MPSRSRVWATRLRFRNRVIEPFEAAALTDDPWMRRRLLTFVVVGAGHAGTELMAAVEELTRGILVRHYPSVPPETVRLVLVGSQVLPQTATNLAAYTKEKLVQCGGVGRPRPGRSAPAAPRAGRTAAGLDRIQVPVRAFLFRGE